MQVKGFTLVYAIEVVFGSESLDVRQLLDTEQQLLALVQFVQIPQQLALSSGQHTDGSKQVGLLSKTNLDNKLVFVGPLSAIKDTNPNRAKTIINSSLT